MRAEAPRIAEPQDVTPDAAEIMAALRALHADLRERLRELGAPAHAAVRAGPNPKGDEQRLFDVLAHHWVRGWLAERFAGGVILSEEASGEHRFGSGPPVFRFVVDPVDGSDNHARALPLSALCVALLPPDAPLSVERVDYALVGGLDDGGCALAARGGGAFVGEDRLATSSVRRIEESLISCELNHWAPDAKLAATLARCRGVRSYGCASRALTLVARGALDAHIDVRGRLTPESFLAASLILTETKLTGCGPTSRNSASGGDARSLTWSPRTGGAGTDSPPPPRPRRLANASFSP